MLFLSQRMCCPQGLCLCLCFILFFSFKFQFQSILHLKFTWKFDNDLFSYIICVRITIENQTEFSILCHFLTKRWDTFEIGLLSKEIFFSYSIRLEGSICVEEGPLFNIRINHRWIHFITFTSRFLFVYLILWYTNMPL